MRRLSQSLARTEATGTPLPGIFPKLDAASMTPRRGQVSLVVGQPNAGKSLLALHYTVKHNLPTLYLSADTDEATVAYRASAMLTGQKVNDVEKAIMNGGGPYYEDVLDRLDNVRFCFDPSPTLDDIDLEILAFEEVWGCAPDLVVVDNLMNVVAEHDNEFAGMREISKALHHIARSTQSHVMVLHHTTESAGSPLDPPRRRDIQGKVSQLPELILGVALNVGAGEYKVACLKNRSGPHNADGDVWECLYVDLPRMALYESYGDIMQAQALNPEWSV
jgi:KaiC/GvpD/RAD55 family RecA-like ATPase